MLNSAFAPPAALPGKRNNLEHMFNMLNRASRQRKEVAVGVQFFRHLDRIFSHSFPGPTGAPLSP
jgi:hypothetical protein